MALTHVSPHGWSMLDRVGPALRPERSAGPIRGKMVNAEYAVAIFCSGAGIPLDMAPDASRLAACGFPGDGTPVITRNAAISRAAGSPDAAHLFLDLLPSRDGRIAFARTGRIPYRANVAKPDMAYETFGSLTEVIGERNVTLVGRRTVPASGEDAFLSRWRQPLRR
jgi:iron(III) transport system substrate-binding protein